MSVSGRCAARHAAALERRDGTCQAKRDMTSWRRSRSGSSSACGCPAVARCRGRVEASLVSGRHAHFLVYDNYDALLGYNCAHAYAFSVALLAERIG